MGFVYGSSGTTAPSDALTSPNIAPQPRWTPLLRPIRPFQRSILDGLAQVPRLNIPPRIQVRDRSCYLQNPVVRPCRQAQAARLHFPVISRLPPRWRRIFGSSSASSAPCVRHLVGLVPLALPIPYRDHPPAHRSPNPRPEPASAALYTSLPAHRDECRSGPAAAREIFDTYC